VEHSQVLEQRHRGELEAWGTGLSDLDEYLEGGLRPGELVIVGARPSQGKTALGLSIGVHMAQARPVAVLSMEMSKLELNDRLTAMLGRVSMSSVKRPNKGNGLEWDRVLDGVERAKSLRLHVSDQGGLNINQVRAKARNAKRLFGLEVLVIDYIGLMSGLDQKSNRNAQLGEISRGLKNLAKELRIAVMCLAQLNRKAEERADQMPQMSDLRDSGEIEQDADVILFIKRPIMNNPDLGDEWKNYAKLSVAKNRQGRCGYLDLAYIGDQTLFTGWGGAAPSKAAPAKQPRGGNL
jgi:replicative DNA helicase